MNVYNQSIMFVTYGKLEKKPSSYCSTLRPISDKSTIYKLP